MDWSINIDWRGVFERAMVHPQEVGMLEALVLAGLAGVVTTVAGLGGGQLLVVGVAVVWDPLTALTVTGPALLVGNLHRLVLFRAHLGGPLARRYVLGALPGALVGGLCAGGLPPRVLLGMMAVMTTLAVARHLLQVRWTAPSWALVPGGSLVGFVAATGGGGGVIAAPLLLGAGARGGHYMAAMGSGAVAVHVGRMAGYGLGGVMGWEAWSTGLALALAIAGGNQLGMLVRGRLSVAQQSRAELGVLVGCVVLAVVAMQDQ